MAFFRASCLLIRLWRRTTSAICSPTVITGFREVMGSWKIMEILPPRISRMFFSGSWSRSCPSKRTEPLSTSPGGSGTRPMMPRAVVVFPAPVSPTRPMLSPFSRVKETPFTAETVSSSVT